MIYDFGKTLFNGLMVLISNSRQLLLTLTAYVNFYVSIRKQVGTEQS